MKLIIRCVMLSFAVLLALPGLAQGKKEGEKEEPIELKQVPRAVIIEFKRSYPNAVIKGCSKETVKGWTRYELETKDGKVSRDILYDPDGTPIVIEESIRLSALPLPVRQAIKREYPGGKVTRQEKIITYDKTQYEVIVKSGREIHELVYGGDGTLAKSEKK